MEFLYDWKFYLFVINFLILAFNWFSHQKIVYNDLKHLSADVKEISNTQKEQTNKIENLEKDISYIKGTSSAESRILKILENTLTK